MVVQETFRDVNNTWENYCRDANIWKWKIGIYDLGVTNNDGGAEGSERGAEARSAKGVGSGEGAIAPPQYGGLGAMPP